MKILLSSSVGLCAILYCSCACAQFLDMSPVPVTTGTIGLKYSHSSFDDSWLDGSPSPKSGIFKLYGMFPLKNGWSINAELPYVIAKVDSYEDDGLANLYVGFQKTMKANQKINLAMGVYLPTIGSAELRSVMGFTNDIYGTFQYIEAVTARFNFAYNEIKDKGFIYGVDIGPDIMIPTFDGGDVELFLHLGAKAGYAFGGFAAWVELNNILPTNSDGYITDEIISNLVFGGQFTKSRFRPGIFYGIPVDSNTSQIVKGTLHVKAEFLIGR